MVGALVVVAHVVDLPGLAAKQRGLDALAVVQHMNPLAHLAAIAIKRNLLTIN